MRDTIKQMHKQHVVALGHFGLFKIFLSVLSSAGENVGRDCRIGEEVTIKASSVLQFEFHLKVVKVHW